MTSRFAFRVSCLSFAAGCAAPADSPPAAEAGSDTAWTLRAAIYEVFVRDFSPAGNLQGVIAGLNRIEAVGANIVWAAADSSCRRHEPQGLTRIVVLDIGLSRSES